MLMSEDTILIIITHSVTSGRIRGSNHKRLSQHPYHIPLLANRAATFVQLNHSRRADRSSSLTGLDGIGLNLHVQAERFSKLSMHLSKDRLQRRIVQRVIFKISNQDRCAAREDISRFVSYRLDTHLQIARSSWPLHAL